MYYKFNRNILWRIQHQDFHNFLALPLDFTGIFVAGGAFRGLLDKEDVLCDIDLFFTDNLISAKLAVELEGLGGNCVFTCPQGNLKTYKYNDIKIQLITKYYYNSPEVLLDSFDINACRFALWEDHVYTDRKAIYDTKKKIVTLHKVTHPNSTFRRMLKYKDKGYTIPKETIAFYTDYVYNEGLNANELKKEFYVD